MYRMTHLGIVIVFVGICSVLCFAKQNFEIIVERAEVSDVDPKIAKVADRTYNYNRTCKAYSLNFTVLQDMDSDLNVEIQGFALYSNEYRRTPINFQRNICDVFKNEFLWIKRQALKNGHFPTQCPVLAGDYYLKDFVPNGADFPAAANFPWKKSMLCLRFLYRNKAIATFKMYVTLDHDIELKRQG